MSEEHIEFLDELKSSGICNMFSAGPHLQDEFGVSKEEAKQIVLSWMKGHLPND